MTEKQQKRRAYRMANRAKIKAYMDQWHKDHKVHARQYRQTHKADETAYRNIWRRANAERFRAGVERWRKANLDRRAATQKRYHARKLNAMPRWADQRKIDEFYETANGLGILTGDWYHVDHIVPLQGKTVCGLHCEQNLQVIFGSAKQEEVQYCLA